MKKSLLNEIFNAYLIYKFFPLIIIVIIVLVIGYFKFVVPVNKEIENYGYGKFETVRIDPMTGEIIPKDKIYTYDNSSKKIIDINGEELSFASINSLRDKMCDSLRENGDILDEDTLKITCEKLLVEKLGCTYEIKDNDLYINNMWISGKIDCRDTVNSIIKKIYMEQNGLNL